MMNDRFNEMYLKIVKARGYDTKNNTEGALKIYLEVIENYNPSDDFVYKRACEILSSQGDYTKAKEIALIALKKIKSAEISGSYVHYSDFIKKIDLTEEEQTKANKTKNSGFNKKFSLNIMKKKSNFIFVIALSIFLILISLPDKIFKLIFLIFAVLTFVFLLEIIEDLKQRLSVKVKGFLFILSILLSLYGVFNMPPSNWDQFFKVASVSDFQEYYGNRNTSKAKISSKGTKKVDKKEQKEENQTITSSEISENDLETLKDLNKKEINLDTYKLVVKGDKIALDIKLKAGASASEGQQLAINILNNLNLLKGFENSDDTSLGNLYYDYNINIKIRNNINELILRGTSKKRSNNITWKN